MRYFLYAIFIFLCSNMYAQNDEPLCIINGENISLDKFKRVYEKNRDLIDSLNFQSPDEYLDLFIEYKLRSYL